MARKLAAELDELRRSGALLSSGGIHHHPQYSSSSLPRSIHSKVLLFEHILFLYFGLV